MFPFKILENSNLIYSNFPFFSFGHSLLQWPSSLQKAHWLRSIGPFLLPSCPASSFGLPTLLLRPLWPCFPGIINFKCCVHPLRWIHSQCPSKCWSFSLTSGALGPIKVMLTICTFPAPVEKHQCASHVPHWSSLKIQDIHLAFAERLACYHI